MEERYKKQFLESGVPQLAETLRSSKLSVLPKEKLEKLDNLAARAVAELNGTGSREKPLADLYRQITTEFAPYIGWALAAATDVESFQTQTLAVIEEFSADSAALAKEQKDLIAELKSERTINTVAKHAGHFKDEAKRYAFASYCWLGAAVLVGVLTLCYATLLLLRFTDSLPVDPRMAVVVAHAIPKIILLSLLSVAMAFSIRNYGANCHNYVINSHRMRALSTFDSFLNSTEDPQVKNAILLHTASMTFSPQSTGFTKIDHEIKLSHPAVDLIKGSGG